MSMTNRKIIIIGSGISGLCAGCYLQMNGYDTEIFELRNVSGGLCTAWKRGGYTFDGCIHSFSGLNPDFKLCHYWRELIDTERLEFFYHDELFRFEDENGNTIKFFTDPDRLEKELKSIAPEDSGFIDGFIKAIKKLSNYDTLPSKPLELWTPLDYYLSQFKTAPIMKYLVRWRKSLKDVTRKCKNPLLKRLLNPDFFSHFPAYFFLFSLGHLHNKNAGYPIGGSLPFARLLENRYLGLGGRIQFNSRVTRINVRHDQAIGITLEDGEHHNDADIVISAADGHYTIFQMLEGRYINEKIRKLYSRHPMWPSAVLVSLGVSRTFENEPAQINLCTKKAIVVDERSKLDEIPVTVYHFDPTLAPEGKTCLRVILKTDNYQYWNELRKGNKEKYDQEKDRISKEVIEVLDRRFGNIVDHTEVIDVATPATFCRYTNNWKGSIQGWEWMPGLIPEFIRKELPGLRDFYLIGQWVMPGGGLPSAILTGRDITRIICRKDKRKFRVR